MIKSIQRHPWVSSQCLLRRPTVQIHPARRWLSLAAGATQADLRGVPASHGASGAQQDDAILRQIFDSPSAWKEFSKVSRGALLKGHHVGLFRNAYLTGPGGFPAFARVTLHRAQRIVDKVLGASSLAEYKDIVKDLDRLSDLLCRVIDLSDFVRVTHPDPRIQNAASEAWSMVYQYMNQLNTTTGLNEQLGRAMDTPEVAASWSEEEMTVAQMLKLDFMKSAVNLPRRSRDRFVELSQQISEVGSKFVDEMAPEQSMITLPSSKFQGMNPVIARRLTRKGSVYLHSMSSEAAVALRSVYDEDTRKSIYYASRTASSRSVRHLETLLRLRADLAELAGFESYGHMTLRDRMMAKSPEAVEKFLQGLVKKNAPIVRREMEDLTSQKRHYQHSATTTINAWDKDYYMSMIRDSMRSRQRQDDFLSAYFSLGTIMQGLSRLFTRLYGIRLVPKESAPGETWHPDVRRLDVISDTDGHVAVLYCDLFYREDKSPNPAHFTVRCSREISEREVGEAATAMQESGDMPKFTSPEDAANDGMSLSRSSGVLKQLPTIALVCDFPQSETAGVKPAFLTYFQMETLFHEMGHAIHSILARTSLQNVAGTRCATDLAELPSTLMEHFAADPTVLSLFARHYETDEPLDYEAVAERLKQSRRFEGSDTENQIILAMLDQKYHSASAADPSFNSTDVFRNIQLQFGNLPADPPGTRWQGFFGHLFGYGSTYYSYLFDRVLAERVWRVVFSSGQQDGAINRENGEQLKENLLKWGGSRDPWRCLAAALKDDRVADGDEKAMALVGSWGMSSNA